jgi:ABC-2 type transport system ATP-binding protein
MRQVAKRWAGRAVLVDVDLTVGGGRLVVVRGANGAGKTTLLKIAAGLVEPDAGSVTIHGMDPGRERRAFMRSLGYVSAGDRGLHARLSARRHLLLAWDLALLDRRLRAAAVEEALADFGLRSVADRSVQRLPTGQRQRLKLALAFLHRPGLVLLDEPASSLDPDGVAVLRAALDDLKARGGAALACAPLADATDLPDDESMRLVDGALRSE